MNTFVGNREDYLIKGVSHQHHVAHFSGNANNGTNAGTFYWNLNNSSSNANRNIGSQLGHLNQLRCEFLTPWSNIAPQELGSESEQLGEVA